MRVSFTTLCIATLSLIAADAARSQLGAQSMIVPRDGTKPNVLEGFEVQLFAPRLEDGSLYIVGDTGGWRKS